MSKAKILGIGLASALSLMSVGCAKEESTERSGKTSMAEKATQSLSQSTREDVSVSYISRNKDYVKSVNYLLSLYKDIIPHVEKNAARMGITGAIGDAYTWCRLNGKIKENSAAYSFVDIVQKNYAGEKDLSSWKSSFLKAGQESEKILSEGDSISRKFVPKTAKGFLRRDFVETAESSWKTKADCEQWYLISEYSVKKEY